jgi:hypothetical protein
VVLPGGSVYDIPAWLGGVATTNYVISDYTQTGVEQLLRFLTGQEGVTGFVELR